MYILQLNYMGPIDAWTLCQNIGAPMIYAPGRHNGNPYFYSCL